MAVRASTRWPGGALSRAGIHQLGGAARRGGWRRSSPGWCSPSASPGSPAIWSAKSAAASTSCTRSVLGYLALDRAAPTLSGGEAQRIRLAAQLGSNLRGVCYILDEPTIGLHPRDNRLLLDTLEALKARGNTLLVVEHDEDTIRRADHVIDLGPGAGGAGGRVVAEGTSPISWRRPNRPPGAVSAIR